MSEQYIGLFDGGCQDHDDPGIGHAGAGIAAFTLASSQLQTGKSL